MKRTLFMAAAAVPLLMLTGFASGSAAATEPPAVAISVSSPATDPEPPGDPDEFIQCLRDHGVAVPEPVPGDRPIITGEGPGAPKDLPPGGGPVIVQGGTGGVTEIEMPADCEPLAPGIAIGAVDREQVVAFAQCMRGNGVPDFPLPDEQGDLIVEKQEVERHAGDPAFDGAMKTCEAQLPAPIPAPGAPGAGGEPIRVQAPGDDGGRSWVQTSEVAAVGGGA